MSISKVSIAGRQTRNFIDPFFATYFDEGKIIQDKLDRLGNHSSLCNVIATIVNFAAALLKTAVAVECFYHFRPYYWVILKIFFQLVCDIGRGTSTTIVAMAAVLKWIVIMTLRLTFRIFVGLTTIVVCAFSWLVPTALLALNGVVRVAKFLITPARGLAIVSRTDDWKLFLQLCFLCVVIITVTVLWRRSTKRSVRRRPLFVSESVLETSQSDLEGEDMDFERIIMTRGSREFQTAFKLFHSTIPESKAKIRRVERIKNDFLLERYNRKHEQMKKKLKASNCDKIEKLLFHGTTQDVIDAICKQNFDHRMRGKNGTVYGEGSYFAVKASYSNKYSSQSGEKTRFMFLASVLTGDYTLGTHGFRRPPLKDPNNRAGDLYDSCVDNEEEPNIFVIFNDEQCYPSYLIEYRLQ